MVAPRSPIPCPWQSTARRASDPSHTEDATTLIHPEAESGCAWPACPTAEPFGVTEMPAYSGRRKVYQLEYFGFLPIASSRYSSWSRAVSAPTVPAPTGRWSISTMGTTPA